MKAPDKFAPRKKKYSRGNNMPFMNKLLSRAHMKRTRLRNCYLKKRSEQNRLSYVKQRRNYCVSLLRKTKKDYYANLNVKDIVDNKQFWRTVKSLFSDKTVSNEIITLGEDKTVTTQDKPNAELLNIFFSNAVKNLKIPRFSNTNPLAERLYNPTLKAILKYKNHPSIVAIRNANNNSHFHFNEVSVEEVCVEVHVNLRRVLIFLSQCLRRTLTFLLNIFADSPMSP